MVPLATAAAGLAALALAASGAAPGSPDPGFGTGGSETIVLAHGIPRLVAAQLDSVLVGGGRIWIGGDVEVARSRRAAEGVTGRQVMRLLPDGSPDRSFGKAGTVRWPGWDFVDYDSTSVDVALPDGGAIVVWYSWSKARRGVVRLRRDGSTDLRFGRHGVARVTSGTCELTPQKVIRQPDGKLVGLTRLCGKAKRDVWFAILRLGANGRLDRSFGSRGIAAVKVGTQDAVGIAGAWDVARQPDGKLVIGGTVGAAGGLSVPVLVRLTRDGALDRSFGGSGIVRLAPAAQDDGGLYAGFLVRPDGRIVLAARTGADGSTLAVYRLLRDGSPDPSWGDAGVLGLDDVTVSDLGGTAVFAAPGGKLIVSGLRRFVRLNADGSHDAAFGSGGAVAAVRGDETEVAVQPDGKVLYATKVRPGDERGYLLQRWLG